MVMDEKSNMAVDILTKKIVDINIAILT
jgi:hypothetical protein